MRRTLSLLSGRLLDVLPCERIPSGGLKAPWRHQPPVTAPSKRIGGPLVVLTAGCHPGLIGCVVRITGPGAAGWRRAPNPRLGPNSGSQPTEINRAACISELPHAPPSDSAPPTVNGSIAFETPMPAWLLGSAAPDTRLLVQDPQAPRRPCLAGPLVWSSGAVGQAGLRRCAG